VFRQIPDPTRFDPEEHAAGDAIQPMEKNAEQHLPAPRRLDMAQLLLAERRQRDACRSRAASCGFVEQVAQRDDAGDLGFAEPDAEPLLQFERKIDPFQ